MEELEKWRLINSSTTINELKDAITKIGNIKISNGGELTSKFINNNIDLIHKGNVNFRLVTRNYGIRQQLLYLIHK
jgi:hypothetical protein